MEAQAIKTYEDLIVEVAEALGFASFSNPSNASDNRARMPTDPNRLDIVKRAIVSGMQMLVRDAPKPAGWRCLRREFTLSIKADGSGESNISADASRLRLPPGVTSGPISGSMTFKLVGSNVSWNARHTTEAAVVRALGNDDSVDYPRAFAVMPYQGDSSDDANGWEMRIFPRPNEDMTATGMFAISVPKAIARASDFHPFGASNNDLIFTAAVYARLRIDGKADPANRDYWERQYLAALSNAIAADSSTAPRSHGIGMDPSVETPRESGLMYPKTEVRLDGLLMDS